MAETYSIIMQNNIFTAN